MQPVQTLARQQSHIFLRRLFKNTPDPVTLNKARTGVSIRKEKPGMPQKYINDPELDFPIKHSRLPLKIIDSFFNTRAKATH